MLRRAWFDRSNSVSWYNLRALSRSGPLAQAKTVNAKMDAARIMNPRYLTTILAQPVTRPSGLKRLTPVLLHRWVRAARSFRLLCVLTLVARVKLNEPLFKMEST